MKKILLIPFFSLLTLVVFLFSISSVCADTSFNCYYDNFDTYFTIYLSNEEYFQDLISSKPNLLISTHNGNFSAVYPTSMLSSSSFGTMVLANYSSTIMYRWNSNSFSTITFYSSSDISLLYTQCPAMNNGVPSNGFFYSSSDYYLPTAGYDTLVLPEFTSSVFNKTIPSISIVPGDKIPSYYDLYQEYILTPSGPVDEYPVITSFFTLVLNKFSFITDYFSSNYIYLSIFVIFLLVSFLLLIKRRLF